MDSKQLLWRRTWARLIDFGLWYIVSWVWSQQATAALMSQANTFGNQATSFFGGTPNIDYSPFWVYALGLTALCFAYFVVFESTTGVTLGKALMGLRVFDEKNGNITWQQALKRNLVYCLYPPVGGIIEGISMWSSGGQRFGDRWAGTHVAPAESPAFGMARDLTKKRCNHCGEEIPATATLCMHCGGTLDAGDSAACPACGRPLSNGAGSRCAYCYAKAEPEASMPRGIPDERGASSPSRTPAIAPLTHSGADQTKVCPFCAEDIKAAAVVCRYCGRDVPAV